MDKNMLRKALWEFLRPLMQLISNILNPECGEKWLEELKKFLRKEPCWTKSCSRPTFLLKINPKLSAEQRIKVGGYDRSNGDLLKWQRRDASIYTGNEIVDVNLEYFHFDESVSTEEAERRIAEVGYRPANFEELTAHGEQHPGEQRLYPIVALGSVFVHPSGGNRCSPCLCEDDAGRRLSLDYHVSDWCVDCRFAVVRKDIGKSGSAR